MPKPSKQSKPDHSRGFTEYRADLALSDLALSRESSSPELSQGALLKNIAEVVAEEGRCMQKMLNDSFIKMESGLDVKVDSIINRINEAAVVTDSLATRQAETETRISALEDDIALLKVKKVKWLDTRNLTQHLWRRLQIWRVVPGNIRILNIKESVEESDPIHFF